MNRMYRVFLIALLVAGGFKGIASGLGSVNIFVLFLWFTLPFTGDGPKSYGFLSDDGIVLALLCTLRTNIAAILAIRLVTSMDIASLSAVVDGLGCLAPDSGTCLTDGVQGDKQNEKDRRIVGLTWQDPDDQLFMPTVVEDVAFGLVARDFRREDAERRALKQLATLGILHLSERAPHRLSGGEKRLVALAGVLVTDPDVLALDEPTASLDPKSRGMPISVLSSLETTLVIATHDLDMALDVCSSAVILYRGSVAWRGSLPGILEDRDVLVRGDLEPPLRFGADVPGFTGIIRGSSISARDDASD